MIQFLTLQRKDEFKAKKTNCNELLDECIELQKLLCKWILKRTILKYKGINYK